MIWGMTFLYATAAVIAAVAAWRTPERIIALVLVANVWLHTTACVIMPDLDSSGIAILTETLSFEAAMIVLVISGSDAALALAFTSIVSMFISAAKALGHWPFSGYEETINLILVIQCIILSRRGLGDVILRMGGWHRRMRGHLDAARVPDHGMATFSRSPEAERQNEAA